MSEDCASCAGPCLIKPELMPQYPFSIATHQAIFTPAELIASGFFPWKIVGPDTLLANWQYAHQQKMWASADHVREIGKAMGYQVVFAKDHYEVHVKHGWTQREVEQWLNARMVL